MKRRTTTARSGRAGAAMQTAAALVLLLLAGLTAGAQQTNPPAAAARLNYESFRIISQRNIFNSNRSNRPDRTPTTTTRRDPEKRVHTESFALLGTLSYDKGSFAFFDGTSSDYKKSLKAADIIAGYKITAIASSHVTLESTNGQAIQLPVGMEMKRLDEGAWLLASRAEASESLSRLASSGDKTGASSGGDADEVLKRLLQKREQEANGGTADSTEVLPAADERMETTNTVEKVEAAPAGGADDVLKKLMQKREKELNK